MEIGLYIEDSFQAIYLHLSYIVIDSTDNLQLLH